MAGVRDAFGPGNSPYVRALGAAVAAGSAAGICIRVIQHRRQQRSLPVAGRRMPGDAVLQGPVRQRTRSILIPAPAGDVWSLLNRVGHGRAGWYLFDRLSVPDINAPHINAQEIVNQEIDEGFHAPENNVPVISAFGGTDRYVPLRDLDIGDLLVSGTGHRLRIKEVQPNEWMLWADGDARSTWLWLLQPVRANQTRLLVRARFRYGLHQGGLAALPLDAVDWATMRRALTGIRDRAVLRSESRFS